MQESKTGDGGMGKEEAKQKIADLVKKYEDLSPTEVKSFNEAKTKQGFIDPLFRALGWNFEDTNEVAPEEKASGGRVDYAFKINTVSQFYLEAKPLRADLTNVVYIKQAVTYAYNKSVTWALLSDFETLAVYVAQTGKPFITLTCNKYLDAFDDLWLLSKESFQSNALAEKAERYGALPQRMGIEQRLFNQLRQWREELSTQLHSYNKHLSIKQIDEVIQRLFNRLIFIRTCEDRGIENKALLSAVHEWVRTKRKGELIEKLRELFRYFDGYYDSELFQKHLTDEVDVESTTIENLINGLYEVPGGMASYDFSIIDADVLGAVYEQYLGHIANIVKQKAKAAQAKMDLGLPYDETIELTAKKQRRKEHGIYYTPKFITDYIVKETVGRFLAEHSTNEIRNIKILDPACGSGSFLIRAFDELLKHYAHQKISKSEQDIDAADRISILQSNIFGVDLDIQAVEIARLNLLLRSLAKRDTLPGLKNNIKEGNSLISGTEEELKKYFGKSWKDKKAFSWEQEFKDIMDNGGFDVVIGNPPYVRVDSLPNDEKVFWKNKFVSTVGKYDLYYLFLELAFKLVNNNGVFAFITPNHYCTNTTGEHLRKLILSEASTIIIASVSHLSVFEEAANYPVITIVYKSNKTGVKKLSYFSVNKPEDLQSMSPDYELTEKELKLLPRSIIPININEQKLKIALRLIQTYTPAGKVLKIQEGLRIPTTWEVKKTEGEQATPIIKQFQFSRYSEVKKASCLSEKHKKSFFSSGADRIINCQLSKLLFAEDALRIESTLDKSKGLCQGGVYFATLIEQDYSLYYLLALFNSKLLTFIFKCLYSGIHMGGGFLRFRTQYLQELPIRRIDFKKPNEKKMHDTLVSLVERMLELNKKYAPIRDTPFSESEELKKEIERTDKEIDNLVYDLYGLTEEDRKIVEGI